MPSIHVDDDGALTITLDPSEVVSALASARPTMLLEALGNRLAAPAVVPDEQAQEPGPGDVDGDFLPDDQPSEEEPVEASPRQRGRPRGRTAVPGGYHQRFLVAMKDGKWRCVDDLAASLGKSTLTGSSMQTLRDLVKQGVVEVRGAAGEREWRLAP